MGEVRIIYDAAGNTFQEIILRILQNAGGVPWTVGR